MKTQITVILFLLTIIFIRCKDDEEVLPVIAKFSASDTTVLSGTSITFTDESINNPIEWNWSFEGGNPSQSTEQNPAISYELPGVYSVSLKTANSSSSDELIIEKHILVLPASGLVAYYPLNGNVSDKSGNNLDGTFVGGVATANRHGDLISAYDFDGRSNYLQLPNEPAIKPKFPFSISLWVAINELSSTSTVIYASDESKGFYSGFWIGYIASGEVSAGYGDGIGHGSSHRISKHSDVILNTQVWQNITAVFNGLKDIDVYVDGGQGLNGYYSGSATSMGDTGATGAIGRSFGHHSNSFHDGGVDDIFVYNRALSIDEIGILLKQ